jgi:cytidylate kinase
MSVITISRGSFSGGKMLAESLASRLAFRCIDRDVIVERAAARGVSQDELLDALLKPPTFLERFKHKRYLYLALIQAALAEEVRTGKVVYHGNAGHLLLKGATPVLRVRIIAPLEFRLKMVGNRLKLSRQEGLAYIQKVDEGRRRWTHFLYGVDWEDPSLYDLVINLEHMNIDEACSVLEAVAKRQKCFQFTEECQTSLDDLALASRIRANLAIDPATSHLEVEVAASRGAVRIKGKLTTPEELGDVRRVALAVPGVASLNLDEVTSPVRA